MTASLFLVRGDQGKNPVSAINLLGGAQAKRYLADYYAGLQIPQVINLPSDSAMLMSGTTAELQEALRSDFSRGLEYIMVKDLMAIWYVRRSVPGTISLTNPELPSTETVVSIASVQGYWGLRMNDPRSIGYRWLRLYRGYCVNGALSLDFLANQLLPMAKGVKPWSLEIDAVATTEELQQLYNEAHLRNSTPQGLAMSPDQNDTGRLVGDLHVVFNDAAKQALRSYLDDRITLVNDPAKYKPHVQVGFPTVLAQFMTDVDRAAIRVGGDRARGTLLKKTGGEDPRVALHRFAGTEAGALNLSKLVCQLLPTALLMGSAVALADTNGRRLDPRPAHKFLPGNDRAQFISVARQGDRFVIDYEVEHPLAGFSRGTTNALSFDDSASSIKASVQISISARDLEAGNLTSYTVTKPPQVTIHTEMTTDSLARQVAGQVV